MENQTNINLEESEDKLKITMRNYKLFVESEDGKLINTETGEVVTNIANILEHYHLTVKIGKKYSDEYYKFKWQRKHKFAKLYQIKMSEAMEHISHLAKAMLLVLISNLEYKTGEVLVDGFPPKNPKLSTLCGYSTRSVSSSLKELEDIGIISIKGSTTNRIIFVNPEYGFNGENLLKSTYKLFNK